MGTNTSDWLESCGVKTMLSKQSLHSAHSIYIFHSELTVIACVVLRIAVSGLMLRLKAKELKQMIQNSGGIKTGSGAIHSLGLYVNKCQFPNIGGSFVK